MKKHGNRISRERGKEEKKKITILQRNKKFTNMTSKPG
jgi:hypothetical protein